MDEGSEVRFEGRIDIGSSNDPRMKMMSSVSWFMTSIESRDAHKSGDRWKHEGHKGFRQVQASMRIITQCFVFLCIMICWLDTPIYLSFYMPRG
jgi:hypothetical protein